MVVILLLVVFAADVGGNLLCPPDVKSFSNGAFENTYYTCKGVGAKPTLARCPHGHYYKASTQDCYMAINNSSRLQMGSPKDDDMVEYTSHVLGRPVMIGSVYDARRNQIYATTRLWSSKTVKNKSDSSKSFSSDVSFFAAQSTFDRMAHMDISANLKLEFLGGLVSVEGSASYLKDSVESENTVAFMLKGKYRTQTVMLPSDTPVDNKNVCNLKTVTHVVTALTYGMDAYFAFKKDAKSSSQMEKIKGELKVAIKSIPSIKVEAGVQVKIDGSMAKKIEGIDAKLRGDFILKEQPTTYNESVLVFKNLTKQLGKEPEYENAAKMQMVLTPIRQFCDKSTTILLEISEGLLNSVTKMLDELEQTTLKAKTLSQRDVVKQYPPLGHTINLFMTRIDEFVLKIKGELQSILPRIRGGGSGSGEKELTELLTMYTKSPFNFERCRIFFITRTREIEVLNTIFSPENFRGTKIEVVDYEQAGDVKVMFEKNIVLTLIYNIIPDSTVMEQFLNGTDVDESNAWFNNRSVDFTLSTAYKDFLEFAKANDKPTDRGFQVAMHDAKPKLLNIFAQKNNKKVTADFETPKQPAPINITSNEFDSFEFTVPKPRNPFIDGFRLLQWMYGRKTSAIETPYKFSKFSIYNVKSLVPNEVYQFQLRYTTAVGNSPYSEESEYLMTKPCSPPSNLQKVSVTSSSISVSWDTPIHIGKGVKIVDYAVELIQGNVTIKKEKTDSEKDIVLRNIEEAAHFKLSVSAIAKLEKRNGSKGDIAFIPESSKTWLDIVTAPEPPSTPRLAQVACHSATLLWDPPRKIAKGSKINEYRIRYEALNNSGNKTISSSMEISSRTTSITLTDLVQGTTYGVKVKVMTTLGSSGYSHELIIKTSFKETELDKLRKSVDKQINHEIDRATDSIERKIGTLDSKLTQNIGTLDSKLTQNIRTLDSKLTQNIGTLDSKLTQSIGTLDSKFTQNINRDEKAIRDLQANVLQVYYSKHHIRFIGVGMPESETSGDADAPMSLGDCMDKCQRKHDQDRSWNGIKYSAYDRWCCCKQNDIGHHGASHGDSYSEYFHFRFE